MRKKPLHKQWLDRAHSNLMMARMGKVSRIILYEDLCFDCQQAAEKALKSLMVFNNIPFQWTHNIGALLKILEKEGIPIPEKVLEAIDLSIYAVRTRYPGEDKPVSKNEYLIALSHAENIFKWANKILK